MPDLSYPEPPSDWLVVFATFDPDHERLREALCTLGNGYVASRGAAEEAQADDIHYPGTYLPSVRSFFSKSFIFQVVTSVRTRGFR